MLLCFNCIVDTKKTLCAYFKAGVCEKGKKCKYSHDLSIEDQKQASIDIYSDPRTKIGKAPDTIITCKDFIDAVEKNLYGFNWKCPVAGDECQYRHNLPPGYVLNRDKGKAERSDDDDEDKLTFEEQIEEERKLLTGDLTPVTFESFMAWKAEKAKKKQEELEAKIKAEESKGKKDKSQMRFMSGKALFTYNPDMFVDDDAAGDIVFEDDEEKKQDNDDKTADFEKGASASAAAANNDEEVKVDKDLFEDAEGADDDIDFD